MGTYIHIFIYMHYKHVTNIIHILNTHNSMYLTIQSDQNIILILSVVDPVGAQRHLHPVRESDNWKLQIDLYKL